MYEFEIYFKGVDDPVIGIGDEEDRVFLCENMGSKAIMMLEGFWGDNVYIRLRDAYVFYTKEINQVEDEFPIDGFYITKQDEVD